MSAKKYFFCNLWIDDTNHKLTFRFLDTVEHAFIYCDYGPSCDYVIAATSREELWQKMEDFGLTDFTVENECDIYREFTAAGKIVACVMEPIKEVI